MNDITSEFDVGSGVSGEGMVRLNTLAEKLAVAELDVAELEKTLSESKKYLQHVRTKEMPDLMIEMEIEEVVHKGMRFSLNDFISGSIPSDETRRRKAFIWLEDNGSAQIIKTNISLDFGRGDYEAARQVEEMLAEEGHAPTLRESVHASTLKAWARERLEAGESIDLEVLGLYVGKAVSVKKVAK